MIGSRAKWIHTNDTREESEERGCVVAVERGGMPAAWSVLVLSDQGDLRSPPLDRLTIEPAAGAEERASNEQALDVLRHLGAWVAEQHGIRVTPDPVEIGDLVMPLLQREREAAVIETTCAKVLEAARTELAKITAERDALLEGKKRKSKKSDKSDEESPA